MSIVRYSVRNPVLVNLLMVAILILGMASLAELPRELSPKVSFNWAFIVIPFPGVGAEEVEKLIVVPVEEELEKIDDVKTISAEANEGGCFIMVQFEDMSNDEFKEHLREVVMQVNSVELPEDAFDPIVDEFSSDDFMPVISVSIAGDISEQVLKQISDDLRDDLLDIDGIAQVAVTGTREREIWIEVDPRRLTQHNISMSQVAQAVSSSHFDLAGGDLYLGRESVLVRTVGEVDDPSGFNNLVVRWNPSGKHIQLGDVAKISDTWQEESSRSRIDGEPAVTLSISKRTWASSLDIIEEVKTVANSYESRLPQNAQIVFTNDNGIWIKDFIGKLTTNAQLGFLLVMVLLYLFMGFWNALVAAIGLPVAFMATFILMNQFDQSLSGSAMFGLILVLGIVVDDAIIVVENCYRHFQNGKSRVDAAIDGAHEVAFPVISATLTTIAAFSPLIFMSGIMGKFMRIMPIIVILTLAASMIEVFLIAPSHFADLGKLGTAFRKLKKFFRGHSSTDPINPYVAEPEEHHKRAGYKGWFIKTRRIYTRILIRIFRKRFLVGPALIVLLIIMGIFFAVFVDMEFFHGDEISQCMVWVTMPSGTRLEDTDRVIHAIEDIAEQLPQKELHTIIAAAGILQGETDWIFADHVGQVIVDLVEKEFRDRSLDDIIAELREKISKIPGPVDVKIEKVNNGPPVGKPVDVKVKGKHLEELAIVADEVKAELAEISGTRDIGDDNYIGKREVQLKIDPARAAIHGLTVTQIALEVRTALEGMEAAVYREGDEEIDVRVKMAGAKEGGEEFLKSMPIMTATGAMVRLDNLCDFEMTRTLFRIRRFNQERAISVSANVDNRTTTAVKVNMELERRFKDIALRHPGYRLDFRGEMKEFQDSMSELGKLFGFGVILIIVILVTQFKSVKQATIMLLPILFGLIGSMLALIIIRTPLSITAMYGMVALAGIAVNDAIVMISFINDSRARGAGKFLSIIRSGRIRLRPIILTTMTTIIGLLPMAIGLGGKSESWGPLASTIVGGMIAATILNLLVIPPVYSIVVDELYGLKPLGRWIEQRRAKRFL
ncbi:efflux RND transporter permease subunit [Calditrichota bacterium]